MWNEAVHQVVWTNSPHEILCAIAWGVYAVLLALRFVARQSARRCAASAIAGFAFLIFAVLGAEFVAGLLA
jgi:ABC-type transport system involved in cytochrome c biogenesis permease subunit